MGSLHLEQNSNGMADLSKEETRLYQFLLKRGTPADQQHIQQGCNFEDQELARALNGLIQKSRIEIFNQGANILFSAVPEENLASHKVVADLPHDEGLAYQVIERAGDNGVWMGTIRRDTSLAAPRLKKVLKSLQAKKLIKSFKSFRSKAKLLYIRYDLQPNKKLGGGVFWDISTNTYDIAFIDTIKKFFSNKIQTQLHATIAELRQAYVTELRNPGIAQVDLEDEDIESVVQILIFDGVVEPVITLSAGASQVYRPSYMTLPTLEIAEMPCTRCPVAHACSESGDITPATCVYMQQWLDF